MAESLEALAIRKVRQYTKKGKEAEGFIAFCRECVSILADEESVGSVPVAFKLWPEQERFAHLLANERKIISLKPRQVGWTMEILSFILYLSLFWMNQEALIIEVNQDESKKQIDRLKFMIEHLPEWCTPTLDVCNTSTIKFNHTGSIIEAKPSTKNAGIGRTPNIVLIDEFAYQIYAKQILETALPGLEKRKGWMILNSTANGIGNYYEQEWRKCERGESDFKGIFASVWADPNRTQAWYDDLLAKRGPDYMHEKYPRTPQEAFLASSRPFFDPKRIAADLEKTFPEWEDGYLDRLADGKIEFVRQIHGTVRVWKRPEPGKKYVIFSDVSEGLEKGDYSAAYCVPVGEPRSEAARVHGKMDPGELADVLELLGMWYSFVPAHGQDSGDAGAPALLAVEANNMGILTNDVLKTRGYSRLYYQRNLDTGVVDSSGRAGWLTTGGARGTRHRMLGAFQQGYRLQHDLVVDRELVEEMSSFFHRGPQGKAQAEEGGHDDRVMARAGATYLAQISYLPDQVDTTVYASEHEKARLEELKRMSENSQELNRGLVELGG